MLVKKIFYWFLIGVGIGYFTYQLISVESEAIEPSIKLEVNRTEELPPNLVQTNVENVKKIRILCFLSTMSKSHSLRAVHITETWGKHCDKLLLFSSVTDVNIGAIGFNVTEGHGHIWGRVKLMMKYIYKNFLDEYDWFLKADDDTFLITENLRYMLSAYSTEDPIYFGYKFNTSGRN